MLKDQPNLRTVTWDLKLSLDESGNDAYIARSRANRHGLRHDFYETGLSAEPVNALAQRLSSA